MTISHASLTETTLDAIENAIDTIDADIDCERADNVLTLTFENGSKIIINSHNLLKEIWVAAKAGGFHYQYREKAWHDTRNGTELFATLSACISEQAGETVHLQLPASL